MNTSLSNLYAELAMSRVQLDEDDYIMTLFCTAVSGQVQHRTDMNLRHSTNNRYKVGMPLRLTLDDGISVGIILVCDTLHNTAQAFSIGILHEPSPHR